MKLGGKAKTNDFVDALIAEGDLPAPREVVSKVMHPFAPQLDIYLFECLSSFRRGLHAHILQSAVSVSSAPAAPVHPYGVSLDFP
jgi:hypothetical protein